MNEPATTWDFFVDESGDFTQHEDFVVVTGILVPASLPEGTPEYIKKSLQSLAPNMPWPLHTCVLRTVAWLPATRLALRIKAVETIIYKHSSSLKSVLQAIDRNEAPDPTVLEGLERRLAQVFEEGSSPLSVPLQEYLKRHKKALLAHLDDPKAKRKRLNPLLWTGPEWREPPPFDWAVDLVLKRARRQAVACARAIACGNEPDFDCISQMEGLLSQEQKARVWLEGLVIETIRGIKTVLSHTARLGAMLFCASESTFGDFAPPGDGKDRYLSLLEALLVRLVEVLERTRKRHIVRLRVARRYVFDPELPVERKLHVVRDLPRLCQNVSEHCQSELVVLKPYETPKYSSTTHPGFVFADFGANTCRHCIMESVSRTHGADDGLACLESAIRQGTGIRPRSGEPSRTHLQAGGTAWKILQMLRAGDPDEAKGKRRKKVWAWALDQANEWASK
jgi:hypothetical protein